VYKRQVLFPSPDLQTGFPQTLKAHRASTACNAVPRGAVEVFKINQIKD